MKVLAFDTSSRATLGIALLTDGQLDQGFVDSGDVSVNLAKRIAQLWSQEIEAVVVACGPGSYTGIRIGLAAARGLATASGIPVFGMDSVVSEGLELLAKRAGEAVQQAREPEPAYE